LQTNFVIAIVTVLRNMNEVSLKNAVIYFHLQEAMRNILLLFAKLNPAICYVQGMNEVLAPILYVFSTDTDEQNAVRNIPSAFGSSIALDTCVPC
jgi:hypothetical protein